MLRVTVAIMLGTLAAALAALVSLVLGERTAQAQSDTDDPETSSK